MLSILLYHNRMCSPYSLLMCLYEAMLTWPGIAWLNYGLCAFSCCTCICICCVTINNIELNCRPAYPHDFGVQYTGFRLILRPSPLVSLLYDICKILTIMYDIVFVWQYLIIAHQNIRLVGAQWKGNSEMEPVLNTLGCTRFGHSIYSISWRSPF